MNWLAHLHLSGEEPALRVGGLLADFVRGVDLAQLAPDLRAGVELHRRVDRFTDSHPAFRCTRRRLFAHFGHYAGVVADVAFDHVLARDWSHWSAEPLPAFSERVFAELQARDTDLTPALRKAWPRMRSVDLFVSYRTLSGTARALAGLARRTRRGQALESALPQLRRHAAGIERDFCEFFPEIQEWALRVHGV